MLPQLPPDVSIWKEGDNEPRLYEDAQKRLADLAQRTTHSALTVQTQVGIASDVGMEPAHGAAGRA